MQKAKIGIIGGTGLYEIDGAKVLEEVSLETPWGKTSDSIIIAEVDGIKAAFLPRHGRGHVHLPHEINYRANIAALRMVGVEQVLAFSASGSLKEEIRPLDFVLPDQVIDRTRSRAGTFFGRGVAVHITFAHPFCERLHQVIIPVAEKQGIALHKGETVVCMEGPAFSTRAESFLYRSWGAGVINMSTIPEAKLAREAELCYALVCMSTDYDCWKEDVNEHVTIEMVFDNLKKNAERAKNLLRGVLPHMDRDRTCACGDTLKYAIVTAKEKQDPEQSARLRKVFPEHF